MPAFYLPRDRSDDAYSLQCQLEDDAYFEGLRAGQADLPCSLNPYAHVEPEHAKWHEGWRRARAQRVAADLRARARRPCVPCTCFGKGLCRDAA